MTDQPDAWFSTAVSLRGRRILLRYRETPHAGVPVQDIQLEICNCARLECGAAFAIESDVSRMRSNKRRFCSSRCQKIDWRYTAKLREAGVERDASRSELTIAAESW